MKAEPQMPITPGISQDLPGNRILVADDQTDVLEALRLLLKNEGYEMTLVSSPAALLGALSSSQYDLLLMDLNYARDTTSGREGLDLLTQIRKLDEALPVVAMTAWGSIELAVEIMREGVRDFVLKPWDNSRLLRIVSTEIERGHRSRQERNRLGRLGGTDGAMEEAQRTQMGFLPREIPQVPGCEVSGAWLPVFGVGGDYFDVMQLDAEHFGLCIADVAGKGMAAALLMSNLQATVRSLSKREFDPADLTAHVNHLISENTAADRFITFFYAIFNSRTREITYCNAGHNPPIVLSRTGTIKRLSEGGQALGLSPELPYEQRKTVLCDGDRMMLFTDGITEAVSGQGEELGESRLIEMLIENAQLDAPSIQKNVLSRVAEFCGQKFQDDATLILLAVG